jgi:hypothetical protein
MTNIFRGTVQVRRKASTLWTSENPVLLAGEQGLETDTRKFKFGDGVNAWIDLEYASADGIGTIDGGSPDSVYGGTTPVDGGTP